MPVGPTRAGFHQIPDPSRSTEQASKTSATVSMNPSLRFSSLAMNGSQAAAALTGRECRGLAPEAVQPSGLLGTMVVVECFCAGEVCVALSSLPFRWRVRSVVRELTLPEVRFAKHQLIPVRETAVANDLYDGLPAELLASF